MALNAPTSDPTQKTASLGGNQLNPTAEMSTPDQMAQGQSVSGPSLGGAQVAAPGVNPNPNDPTMPGYQYGTGPTNLGIQGSVAGGVPDYSTERIAPAGMPVQSVGSGQDYMQQMQDAYMRQAQSRLDPQWEQQQSALENQLQQQGLTRGSSAWNAEMDRLQRGKTDAYQQAMHQAILSSGAEAERMQRMGIAGGEFANKQAQQEFLNKMASQDNYNAALKEKFEANLKSGMYANAAQAQEAAQKALDAQIRNAAMGTQESGALGRESLELEKQKTANQVDQFLQSIGLDRAKFETMSAQEQQKITNQAEQFAKAQAQQAEQFEKTFAQNSYQFERMSAQDQEKINNQAAQFAQTYELQTAQQRAQVDQFAQTLGMTGKQLDAQISQWAQQNGISREQMAQQLAISQSQMTQQDKQFYATLAETQASRAQQAAQFAQSYDLQSQAQKNQVDQFAQQMGMTGRQLDAQINKWAEDAKVSREQIANALAIARVQAEASVAAAGAQAGATVQAAGINAQTQQARLAHEVNVWMQQLERQKEWDPLLQAQLSVNILNSGGTLPPTSSGVPTTPSTAK